MAAPLVRAVLAIGLLLAPANLRAGPAEDAHVASIEVDLRPPIEVAGGPIERHTLAQAMANHHVQAVSVAVADGGRIVWAKAWGFADAAGGVRATPATISRPARSASRSPPARPCRWSSRASSSWTRRSTAS